MTYDYEKSGYIKSVKNNNIKNSLIKTLYNYAAWSEGLEK